MTRFGLKLMSELRDARTLVRHAQVAEERGLEFVCISDHIHPWLPEHDHSPFAWTVLGAVAAATDMEMATGLTCPIGRYHPLVIAHAAATVASMSSKPFTLTIGAGERLNEHVTGDHFPAVDVRHDMLTEAGELMRRVWEGGFHTYRGRHFTAEDARIYDLPETPIRLGVGVSGEQSLGVAKAVGADAIMAVDPDASLVSRWDDLGGDPTATWSEIPLAWAPTEEEGLRLAHERMRFAVPGWKVMAELPNPVNFDAATAHLSPEQVGEAIPHGPDPEPYAETIRQFVDAGFTNLSLIPIGDDVEKTLDFFESEVRPLLD